MTDKTAKTQVVIHELIAARWSGRAYDAGRPVERKKLLAVIEASRWAPSCFNDQPWRYLLWDRYRDKASWKQAFDCLAEGNQRWVINAPVLLLATANSEFRHNAKPNRWGQYDTGAASENICLQATASGLMAHQMGGFDAEKVRKAFAIPANYSCMAMIAIGYPGDPAVLPEDIRESELAERQREPLQDHFFETDWQRPLSTS